MRKRLLVFVMMLVIGIVTTVTGLAVELSSITTVDLIDLGGFFNNDGISYYEDPLDGDLTFQVQTLPAELLPEAGEVVSFEGVHFIFPEKTDRKYNNIAAYNQQIMLPLGKYYDIYLLATATNGPQEEEVTVFYQDGSVETLPLKVSPGAGGAIFGEREVLSVDYLHGVTGRIDISMSLWLVTIPLDHNRVLKGVKLPENPDIHIFALSLGKKEELVSDKQIIEKEIAVIQDPEGDDRGPGSYVYPVNETFKPGVFDITEVRVVEAGGAAVFKIRLNGSDGNPWGAPNGFSLQLFHIYFDLDGKKGSGVTRGIPGANIAFASDDGWEKAVIAEGGWGTEVEAHLAEQAPELAERILVSHSAWVEENTINIPVPIDFLGSMPASNWGIQVMVFGQEGSKQSMDGIKIRRVVKADQADWQFGGGDDSPVHPNVIDMLVPEGSNQFEILGKYKETGDYSIVPMVNLD